MRTDTGHTDQYPQVGAVLGEVVENASPEDDHNSDGGVQLPPSY